MICLIGHSCAGKSTIERILTNKWGYKRIISYTSRAKRECEEYDVDYHFVTKEDFLKKLEQGFFAEHTEYNGWLYGIAKEDCIDDAIAVVEPVGFRRLKKIPELNIVSFFIKVDERERLGRMMDRKDNVVEAVRRIFSDQGSFNGIEDEINYVIPNPDSDSVEGAAWLVHSLFQSHTANKKPIYIY